MAARILQIFLAPILVFLLNSSCLAVQLDNLCTVVIQVTDNTLVTRNQHLPIAFEQVIKRVSSSQNILQHPEYLAAREHLDRFVSHYYYTENAGAYNLTLRFNEQMINHLLGKIGRTTLGKNRPQVLLWLVVEQNNQPNFVTYGPQTEIAQQTAQKIDTLANTYGVPIILPLVDLTERLFISESDVINFNVQPLQQAAERYSTNTMLLGKANNVAGVWHCEWRLVEGQENIAWNSTSNNLDQELEQMINRLADQLIAHKHNIQENTKLAKLGITVQVSGIKSVTDYAKVLDLLKRLPPVQQVDIGSIDGNQATFILTADGGAANLQKALQAEEALLQSLAVTYKVNS